MTSSVRQRRRWLADVLSVKTKVAYCITELEAGTDVSGIHTEAKRNSKGWILNGSKIWIHNAPSLARRGQDVYRRRLQLSPS